MEIIRSTPPAAELTAEESEILVGIYQDHVAELRMALT